MLSPIKIKETKQVYVTICQVLSNYQNKHVLIFQKVKG